MQSFPFETRSEGVNWSLRTWCEKAGATKGGWRVAFGDGQGAKCSWPVRDYQVTPPLSPPTIMSVACEAKTGVLGTVS